MEQQNPGGWGWGGGGRRQNLDLEPEAKGAELHLVPISRETELGEWLKLHKEI